MRKFLSLVLLLSANAFAATITDAVLDPVGAPFSGSISIIYTGVQTNGQPVKSSTQKLCTTGLGLSNCTGSITSGKISVNLVPNDQGINIPTQSISYLNWYVVVYTTGSYSYTTRWNVPIGGPFTIRQVEVAASCWNGTILLPGACTGGASAGGATIAPTSNTIRGDGAGNGVAATGSAGDCMHVDGSSAACPSGTTPTGTGFPHITSGTQDPAAVTLANGDIPSTLTGKTVDGVTPTVFTYLDPTSSVQTQLNAKAASNAAITINGTTCTLGLTCTVLPPATAVTPASYTCANITVQQDGRLTSAANGSCSGGSGGGYAGSALKTANYTTVTGDSGYLIVSNGTTLTMQLPSTNPGGTWWIGFVNINASPVTISRNTKTINGGNTDIVLNLGQTIRVYSDGTNYMSDAPISCSADATCTFSSSGLQIGPNTATMLSKATAASGSNPQRLVSASASGTAYTACPSGFAAVALSINQSFFWTPDVTNSGTTPSLNVCSTSAVTLTDRVGSPLVASVFTAGVPHWITNDNSNPGVCCFRVTDLPNGSYTLPAKYQVKSCVVIIGDPGAASPVLANDNDSPGACTNDVGSDWTITSASCYADAGSPTVTPILTGGSGTSIVSGAITCGTASWAAGTISGTPVVHSFSANGATCSSTPCTADMNITSAGGTAKYVVLKITGTY